MLISKFWELKSRYLKDDYVKNSGLGDLKDNFLILGLYDLMEYPFI